MRVFTLFIALSLAACADAGTSDDEDTSSTSDIDTSSTGADASGSTSSTSLPSDSSSGDGPIYDVGMDEGTTYLLALSTPIDPALPLQFLAEIAVDDAMLVITMQPLSLDQGSTTAPRVPVGTLLVPTVEFMTPAFSAQLDDAAIPGAANPSSGEDIAGSITLTGSLAGAGTPCGQADGMITAPLAMSLAGSTWAATPVADVDALPDDFPVACP